MHSFTDTSLILKHFNSNKYIWTRKQIVKLKSYAFLLLIHICYIISEKKISKKALDDIVLHLVFLFITICTDEYKMPKWDVINY